MVFKNVEVPFGLLSKARHNILCCTKYLPAQYMRDTRSDWLKHEMCKTVADAVTEKYVEISKDKAHIEVVVFSIKEMEDMLLSAYMDGTQHMWRKERPFLVGYEKEEK